MLLLYNIKSISKFFFVDVALFCDSDYFSKARRIKNVHNTISDSRQNSRLSEQQSKTSGAKQNWWTNLINHFNIYLYINGIYPSKLL